ncbi:hypothetical protein GLOIN_2v1772716 [Rhizophagus clarus]|uniref:RRM domain-containing protein n=1 Tax=Rhizophagus clarus TaxID=94130 RepID=A0A8H3L8G9_9GLOM|nr:hypothetical protein GLOIN_2v1772716 [Rhizophagus clarus]
MRKQRETFTAVVDGVPDSVCKQLLLVQDYNNQDPFFKEFEFKSYKIIKHTGKNRLIAFFENYDDLKNALETHFNLEGQDFRWNRFHSGATTQSKKKTGKSTSRVSEKAVKGKNDSLKQSHCNAKEGNTSAGKSKDHGRLPPFNDQMKAGIKQMFEALFKLLD